MFNYKTGGPKQIWIAGGIGVTPFLSFARDMDGSLAHDVNLYYTVRHPEEAIFVDELEAADARNARLKVHIRYSAKDGSLRIEDIVKNVQGDISSYHVYMCGPLPMTMAFEKKFWSWACRRTIFITKSLISVRKKQRTHGNRSSHSRGA